jgi:hypothetical protein
MGQYIIQTEIQDKSIIKLYEYFQNNQRGIAEYSPRFGKTRCTIELLKKLYKVPINILITYPKNLLKSVWEEELTKWGYYNPNIQFVNFRSLDKVKDVKFDFICIDELHEASLHQIDLCHQIMTNLSTCKVIGLSGTISKETREIWGLQIIDKFSTNEAINKGIVSDYKIHICKVNLDNKIKTPNKKGKLLSEKQKYDNYSFVIDKMRKEGKNYMHLSLSRNRISISSISKMQKVKELLNELKNERIIVFTGLQEIAEKIGIPFYHSKTTDESLLDFQDKKFNHLALVNSGGVGLTYNDLDGVILLNFTSNLEATTQQLFRSLKLDYIEKVAKLFIIAINETPELKKLEETIKMFDKSKIKYI